MRLLALSDLHVNHEPNKAALSALPAHPDDWLILAGDVGDTLAQVGLAFSTLRPRWAEVLWVPGNHELWTPPREPEAARGEARYQSMVRLARSEGVLTPEDPFPLWSGPGGPCRIALLFVLYDYTFRPPEVPADEVLAWALAEGIRATDERLLHPDPFPSRAAWCQARVALSEARLREAGPEPLVVVNHYPLLPELVRLPRVPRYSPWCGTRATADWPVRFPIRVAVHGHLHVRATDWRGGVRFEEVAVGYPTQWPVERGLESYLREILPGPAGPEPDSGPHWHR